MKKKIIIYTMACLMVCLAVFLLGAAKPESQKDPVQDYVTALRTELSNGKAGIINQVMKLTVSEAKVFWPIYYEYEKELFELGDRRLALIDQFVMSCQTNAMDNAQAGAIASDWFRVEGDRLELLKKYNTRITQKLSAVRAAQFVQIEHRTNTVIDLMIASELPLIQ